MINEANELQEKNRKTKNDNLWQLNTSHLKLSFNLPPARGRDPPAGPKNFINIEFSCINFKNLVHTKILQQRKSRPEMHSQKRDLNHSVALLMLYPAWPVRFQTNGWILRNLHANMLQAINFQAPIFNKIASAGELLLELKALRVTCFLPPLFWVSFNWSCGFVGWTRKT